MSSWLNEVHTGMNTIINNIHAIDLVFSIEVCVEALLNVINNWAPGFVVVDKVSEAMGIHNSQTQTNAIFLNVSTDGLD